MSEHVTHLLRDNRDERREVERQLRVLRGELACDLARGRDVGLSVTVMARAAGVSRETGYVLLREQPDRWSWEGTDAPEVAAAELSRRRQSVAAG